jgi:hypothetical protein
VAALMRLRFFDDYGSGWLWADDAASYDRFDVGPIDYDLLPGLSEQTRALAEALSDRHLASYNQDYPPDGCQWPQPARDEFNRQVQVLLARLRAELGAEFELTDQSWVL